MSALVVALVAALLAAGGDAGARAAGGHVLVLSYQVLLGPLPIMTVSADLALPAEPAGGPYRADIVGRSGGYVGEVYDWSFVARSDGTARGPHVAPLHFRGENLSVLDRRPVAISYAKDGTPASRFEPPQPQDGASGLRPAQLKGTLDPASAFVALLRAAATGSCASTVPVFDGRRRFNVIARPAGEELVEPLPRSLFGGPAARCELELQQIDTSRERLPGSGTAWVAEVGGTSVPVRIELATSAGPIIIDLIQVTGGPPS